MRATHVLEKKHVTVSFCYESAVLIEIGWVQHVVHVVASHHKEFVNAGWQCPLRVLPLQTVVEDVDDMTCVGNLFVVELYLCDVGLLADARS